MRIDRALLCAALLLGPAAAVAAPLEPEACATLKTEYQTLLAGGAKADMDRGPDWAKANLTPERLSKIERLIDVQEQLSFRCGEQLTAQPQIKELPKPQPVQNAAAQAAGNGTPGKGVPSNIPPPKRKDAAKAAKIQTTKQ